MKVLSCLISTVLLLPLVAPLQAQTLGMVANRDGSVTVFDADTDLPLGGLSGLSTSAVGDCSLTTDQSLGFVTDFENRVWVIDLSDPTHPAFAGPPIPISNYGEDISISPDGRYLVVCDGSAGQLVSVVDIASRREISTFFLGDDCSAVEVCADGSVLATAYYTGVVRRLTLEQTGLLSDTGEFFFPDGDPLNVFCAPDSSTGFAVTGYPHGLQSFSIPGLVPLDTEPLSGRGIAGRVNMAGDRIFARQSDPGIVWSFKYDAASANQLEVQFAIPVDRAATFSGMDQLAVHPDGSRIYVSQGGNAVDVYDSETGDLLSRFTSLGTYGNTGICLADVLAVYIDIMPGSESNSVYCEKGDGVIPVAVLGSAELDVRSLDVDALEFGPSRSIPALGHAQVGQLRDVNGDGFWDLVLHYTSAETGILCGDSEACLIGRTTSGIPIRGCDTVRPISLIRTVEPIKSRKRLRPSFP